MINHKYKFIYTKITKTASTSVEAVLKKVDGKKKHSGHFHILDEINSRTEGYFKFMFVRNPWARLVSLYFYQRRRYPAYSKDNSTFADFAKSKGPPYGPNDKRKFKLHDVPREKRRHSKTHLKKLYAQKGPFENQLDWISDDKGVVLTNFIGKVENLQEDFNTVCDIIGIPQQKLQHRNKSKHKHYTECYDEESKQIVAEKYAKDIEYFGYVFGE